MTYLKQLPFFLILFASYLTFAQNDLLMSEGRLNGEYSHFNSVNQTTTTGSFKNNLRTGEWTIRDSTDNIIYRRNYNSIFSYSETRVSGSIEGGSQKLYSIERNSEGLYQYPKFEIKDVLWTKRVWSILPERDHGQLYSQEILIRINDWIKKDEIKIYQDDELSALVNKQDVNFSNNNCIGVTMKKDYFFDKKLGLMLEKIVALTFYLENVKTNEIKTFSIFYPTDGRKLLSSFNVSHNSEKIEHYDDLFFFKDYNEIIYNEANAKGIKIEPDFANIEQYQQTSSDIKQIIVSAEHRLWLMD